MGGVRPTFVGGSTGGELATDQWFRGDFAPFGGFEWQPDERWSLKAEYSTDAYVTETQVSNVFERKSSVNYGWNTSIPTGCGWALITFTARKSALMRRSS
nr:YjbH domain-containing protein [Leisingera sp. NJS201]